MPSWIHRVLWIAAALGLAALFLQAFKPGPVLVDTARITRGPLVVAVEDDGRTRVRQRFVVSAPSNGRLLRLELKAGDPVRAYETVVAQFQPRLPEPLDARSLAQARIEATRARAALEEAQASAALAEADAEYAAQELARTTQLFESGTETEREHDRAVRNERTSSLAVRAAHFAIEVAEQEVALAEARLRSYGDDPQQGLDLLQLRSPVDGKVLRVFEESARDLLAGEAILEVGDAGEIEIVADVLSRDAVRVRPGMRVLVEGWDGSVGGAREEALEGTVRLVEPGGFTKVSALGVEEQRVNILIDPGPPKESWSPLQDGYGVDVRIITWEKDDLLTVPTGALFREDGAWTAFVVEDGRARARAVSIGMRSGLRAEVLEGLGEGEEVVLYPSVLIEEGGPVTVNR